MAIPGDEYLVITARDLGAALKHFRTAAGVTQTDAAFPGEAAKRCTAGPPAAARAALACAAAADSVEGEPVARSVAGQSAGR